jgi:hypothetical protein
MKASQALGEGSIPFTRLPPLRSSAIFEDLLVRATLEAVTPNDAVTRSGRLFVYPPQPSREFRFCLRPHIPF